MAFCPFCGLPKTLDRRLSREGVAIAENDNLRSSVEDCFVVSPAVEVCLSVERTVCVRALYHRLELYASETSRLKYRGVVRHERFVLFSVRTIMVSFARPLRPREPLNNLSVTKSTSSPLAHRSKRSTKFEPTQGVAPERTPKAEHAYARDRATGLIIFRDSSSRDLTPLGRGGRSRESLSHLGRTFSHAALNSDDRSTAMRFTSARDVNESSSALEKNIEDTSPSMTSSVRAEGHRDGGDANEDAWEFVGGKKKSGNTPRQNAESAGTGEEGKRRRNGSAHATRNGAGARSEKSNVSRVGGQQLERGATNGASEHVKTAHNDDQKRRQRQKQQQSARLEPSGWAAIVTGRLSPTDVSADAAAIAVTAQTVAVDNVIDSVHDVQLSPGSATSSEDKLSRMDSREVEGSQSPQSDRESQLISGARENAEVVGAGARALKGWASILGGSSAPESQVKDNVIDQGIKAEAVVETSPNKSEDTSGKAPVSPAASTWTGWGVSSPPPKVDLKATMEADAAAAAAAEPTQSSAVKKEVTRTDEKHRKQNGRKKKDVNGKKENKSAKQRQDGYRKDREKISRVKVTVSKPISPPPVDVSMDRPRAPLSSDVEDALAERLGRELIECAHMQYFTPTAQLLKKERRAVDVVIRAMNAIVQTLFPATGVEVFGSYPTRAWVPGSSNLDLSLELPEAISSRPDRRIEALHTLAMALRTNPWVMDVNVVPSSFRPLIRMSTHTAFFQPMPQQLTGKASAAFAEGVKAIVPPLSASSMDVNGTPPLPSGPRPGPPPYGVPGLGQNGFGLPLEVHISLKDGSHKGLSALRFVQAAEEQHGALAPLVCVQKAVLASKGLRGVYKGGLGSYALTMMALTSIQRSSCRGAASNADDASKTHDEAGKHSVTEATETRDAMYVGRAMLDFLKLYGHEADLSKDVISAHTGDASADWGILSGSSTLPASPSSGLHVEDPLEKSNNAGAGCFGISGVQALFREQLEVLRNAADTKFDSDVPLLMQLIMLGGAKKVFIV